LPHVMVVDLRRLTLLLGIPAEVLLEPFGHPINSSANRAFPPRTQDSGTFRYFWPNRSHRVNLYREAPSVL
jgi:hypothetical protein